MSFNFLRAWHMIGGKKNIQTLIQNICSGIIHIEYLNDKSEILGSGTGFIANKLLITNNHVYAGALNSSTVKLSWQPVTTSDRIENITIPSNQFQGCFKSGSDENHFDFAILDVPVLINHDLHNFTLDSNTKVSVGDDALILGFPFEHQNLVCHKAMISSLFESNKVKTLQLDASVNQSNSGGPLINIKSGSVIGIVTRKGTGLSALFNTLIESFDNTITALSAIRGAMIIGNIDPVNVLIESQAQMRLIAREIERSANVGIGYAFSIEYIDTEIKGFS